MFHEGSLVLYFPFGPLPLSPNPLKTVYSQEEEKKKRGGLLGRNNMISSI